jgi:hypothetical protein
MVEALAVLLMGSLVLLVEQALEQTQLLMQQQTQDLVEKQD